MEHQSHLDLWSVADLDLLAEDLDSSLAGLGDAHTHHPTFDMTDALNAIHVIKLNKEEENSAHDFWLQHLSSKPNPNILVKEKAKSVQDLRSWSTSSVITSRPTAKIAKKPCRQRQEEPTKKEEIPSETSDAIHAPTLCSSLSRCSLQPGFSVCDLHPTPRGKEFQYVLAAPTALGMKVTEDTLTYLNQGQAYEIRLKKLQGVSEMRGKLLKSILHVGFQERRLQFRERMEIISWQNQRPTERILDIDLSLSYGIFDVIPDAKNINACEFMWDPTREASVFFKVNCISTEFTSKRRGGEKGVNFRILLETFSHWENPAQKLDAAACLIKVFKSKGADRKHKTDKEKLEKLPQVEQSDLQPSYPFTVFTPCSVTVENIPFQDFSGSQSPSNGEVTTSTPSVTSSPLHAADVKKECFEGVFSQSSDDNGFQAPYLPPEMNYVTEKMTPSDLQAWLWLKQFSKHLPSFLSYSGKDLLCLSREDLIEICGPADGIRLYNSLHIREPPPLKKLYISRDKIAFHAIYLHALRCSELWEELAKTFLQQGGSIGDVYITGPGGILLLVTDKVLQNIKDESTYICETSKEENDTFTIILRTYIPNRDKKTI
ncbi:hypothetical protein JTE90_006902 [Oedothorax gibbosus]|uniref:Grh/CP2 DB domain-containing protein n=1 Tax=Oedothorax gibbosus TaxID=931172 RepID=A0AAV6VQX2_9ARAC|nr:hypothetical protein JTE90_006902 [Oedothorax gibbosus]